MICVICGGGRGANAQCVKCDTVFVVCQDCVLDGHWKCQNSSCQSIVWPTWRPTVRRSSAPREEPKPSLMHQLNQIRGSHTITPPLQANTVITCTSKNKRKAEKEPTLDLNPSRDKGKEKEKDDDREEIDDYEYDEYEAEQQFLEELDLRSVDVNFLDIGMGDSTLIVCGGNGYTILIDCGSTKDSQSAGADALIFLSNELIRLKKLYGFKNTIIHRVYFTHPDQDHYNLFSALHYRLKKMREMLVVQEFHIGGKKVDYKASPVNPWEGKPKLTSMSSLFSGGKLFSYEKEFEGQIAQTIASGITIRVLCANSVPLHGETKANAASLCILLCAKTDLGLKKFLFIGDGEATVEERLIELHATAISRCTCLKLGHHGSDKGTTEDFVSTVNPDYAFASSSMRWAHPYSGPVQRLLQAPQMLRFRQNDPLHTILHGTGSGRTRQYSQSTTNAPFFPSMTHMTEDTSNNAETRKAKKEKFEPTIAYGDQHALGVYPDGTVEYLNALDGEDGALAELDNTPSKTLTTEDFIFRDTTEAEKEEQTGKWPETNVEEDDDDEVLGDENQDEDL
ncbi:MAG: hypothetical protein P4L64_07960 [Caulobacteraceae bacterium]|nr:hypothetical protein [Caulobacteraceae bacterium]